MNTDKDPVRTTLQPEPEYKCWHFGTDDKGDVYVQPKNKRCRRRRVLRAYRNDDGEIQLTVRGTKSWCSVERLTEKDVEPADWRRVITKKIRDRLRPRKKKPVHGYKLRPGVGPDEYYILTRDRKGNYVCGCQEISKTHMVALCRAILQDEGVYVE